VRRATTSASYAGIRQHAAIHRRYQVENGRRSVDELADLIVLKDDRSGQLRPGDIATITDEISLTQSTHQITASKSSGK
jgi:hypothetical protein